MEFINVGGKEFLNCGRSAEVLLGKGKDYDHSQIVLKALFLNWFSKDELAAIISGQLVGSLCNEQIGLTEKKRQALIQDSRRVERELNILTETREQTDQKIHFLTEEIYEFTGKVFLDLPEFPKNDKEWEAFRNATTTGKERAELWKNKWNSYKQEEEKVGKIYDRTVKRSLEITSKLSTEYIVELAGEIILYRSKKRRYDRLLKGGKSIGSQLNYFLCTLRHLGLVQEQDAKRQGIKKKSAKVIQYHLRPTYLLTNECNTDYFLTKAEAELGQKKRLYELYNLAFETESLPSLKQFMLNAGRNKPLHEIIGRFFLGLTRGTGRSRYDFSSVKIKGITMDMTRELRRFKEANKIRDDAKAYYALLTFVVSNSPELREEILDEFIAFP